MRTLLIGKQSIGKSTLLYKLFSNSDKVGGVICLPVFENGIQIGKDAVNLISNNRHLFCRIKNIASFNGVQIGNYIIHKKGLIFAQAAVEEALDKELVIIDEAGPLELSGKGLFNQIRLTFKKNIDTILAMREGIEQVFIEKFPYHFIKVYLKERSNDGCS